MDRVPTPVFLGFPCGSAGKKICLQCGRPGFDPWVGKIPWRRERLPTPVFWPGEFNRLYSPWNSPGQNTGVGSLSLLQRIFPTQGSNPSLLNCRQIFLPAEPQGTRILLLQAFLSPFSATECHLSDFHLKGLTALSWWKRMSEDEAWVPAEMT